MRIALLGALFAVGVVAVSSSARADGALRRFEDAHTPSASSSSPHASHSSAGSSSSGSGGGASSDDTCASSDCGDSAAGAIAGGIVGGMLHAVTDATIDEPPDRLHGGHAFPAQVPYAGDGAYAKDWTLRDDGTWVRDGSPPRRAEIGLGGFTALGERVYGADLKLQGFLGLFVVQGSYERLWEPTSTGVDALNLTRVHIGPNILGPHFKPIELYALVGGAGMIGSRGAFLPAFDVKVEARVYPYAPFAAFASSTLSVFGDGPPLFDNRVELGVSFDRFEIRAGMRSLWREPAQSFMGPVASLTLRY